MKNNNETIKTNNNYIKHLLQTNLEVLTVEEEKQLLYLIKNGDLEAKNELIRRNLRLVIVIAKKFVSLGLDFMI